MPYTYDYPRPALGTDLLIFAKEQEQDQILLIERGNDPYAGFWAFPGGFVEEGESCEQAALRELQEETGIVLNHVQQLQTFSRPNRDPRGWVVTVAFWTFVDKDNLKPVAGDDAKNVKWFPLNELPQLAFDHREILDNALASLKFRVQSLI